MTFDPMYVEVTCVTLPKGCCVQVPWKYIKVCGYSDQFSKTRTKGHWPLDDLWTHVCWGHMCDSNQGSLCPCPMGIHQCMWIQWSICKMTTYYIHILRTEWVITKSFTELSSGETKMKTPWEASTILHNFLNVFLCCQINKNPHKLQHILANTEKVFH